MWGKNQQRVLVRAEVFKVNLPEHVAVDLTVLLDRRGIVQKSAGPWRIGPQRLRLLPFKAVRLIAEKGEGKKNFRQEELR